MLAADLLVAASFDLSTPLLFWSDEDPVADLLVVAAGSLRSVPVLVPEDCLAGVDCDTDSLSEMVPATAEDLRYSSGCVLANNVSPSLLDSGLE